MAALSQIAKNKVQLLQSIELTFEKLLIDYQSIPKEFTRMRAIEGNIKGTTISVCDTLAYLIGWFDIILEWQKQHWNTEQITLPKAGFQWNELGNLADHFHCEFATYDYDVLLVMFDQRAGDIIKAVHTLSDSKLYQQLWYKKYSLGRMIQLNSASPMKNMRTRVRKFIRTQLIQ